MPRQIQCTIFFAVVFTFTLTAGEEKPAESIVQSHDVPEPPSYTWPAFQNWDCVDVKSSADWDSLYGEVIGALENGTEFLLPDAAVDMLAHRMMEASQECPLGVLYFLVLYTYEAMGQLTETEAVEQSQMLSRELRRFPFFIIAAGRWPTFEALNHFSVQHKPMNEKAAKNMACLGITDGSGVNWQELFHASKLWTQEQLAGHEPGEGHGEYGTVLKAAADAIYKDPTGAGDAAQQECPFGFLFLCSTQALAAAQRLTGAFEPWARALDRMLSELPYFSVSGAGWPTFQMLAMFSSLSKGEESATLASFQADVHRWGGTHPASKRFRQYGDLRLTATELAPFGRDREGWGAVDALVQMNAEDWYASVVSQQMKGARRIYGEAIRALHTVMRNTMHPGRLECGHSGITPDKCRERGCAWNPDGKDLPPLLPGISGIPVCQRSLPQRKLLLVSFVWGERWAPLVSRFVSWMATLRLPTILVSMGDACRLACETAVAALGNLGGVVCWDPLKGKNSLRAKNVERGSIVQRHAIVHLLLHMGVDVLAFDFDTFFFADPRLRLEQLAQEQKAEVFMARHLDADCMNMGLLYIQASSRTAEWYSRYMEWLHQHPYEREQRGANSLLRFTKQRVSFPPKPLVEVRAASLDDHNEFASSRGGWLGDWNKLLFFHWVNPTQTHTHWSSIKIDDLRALYEVALHPTTDLQGGSASLAKMLGNAMEGTLMAAVREMMQSMRIPEAPTRAECW